MTRRSPVVLAMAATTAVGVWAVPATSRSALGPRYGGGLTVGAFALPPSVEPEWSPGTGSALVATLVHEPLLRIGPDGVPRPALAEGWSVAAGGREWSVRLRDGARFHDDRLVSSEDAIRALRRFLRGGSPAAVRLAAALDGGRDFQSGGNDSLPGLAADGRLRLVLRFPEPRAMALAAVASPAAAVTSPGGSGAGPFIPTARIPGRRLALTAFGSHVRGRPFLDGVDLMALPEAASAQAEVQSGRLDLAAGSPGISALAATLVLVLDPSRTPFTSLDVRSRIGAAIDRTELVRHLLPGGDPAASLVVPALLPPLGSAPVSSRVALTGAVSLTVDRDVPPSVSRRVVAHLTALGLQVSVQPLPAAAARTARTPARLLLFRPEVAEAALALRELAALAPAAAEAEAALDAADRELNLDRRRTHLHRAEQALRASACLVPLASVPVSFAVRPGIHDASVDFAGRLVLEDAWREP